jgi:hypothetical protein
MKHLIRDRALWGAIATVVALIALLGKGGDLVTWISRSTLWSTVVFVGSVIAFLAASVTIGSPVERSDYTWSEDRKLARFLSYVGLCISVVLLSFLFETLPSTSGDGASPLGFVLVLGPFLLGYFGSSWLAQRPTDRR